MTLHIDGAKVFVAQGGKAHDQTLPLVIFIHGAGMDHSVWALQSRWFAHHGARVAAIDLPGHGGSAGPELKDIGALADWTARLIAAFGEAPATLVGHSMGALIALETAAKHPSRVAAIALLGAAGKMPVSGDLLGAAEANSHVAVDMVSLWGLGAPATMGGNPSPGQWMLGGTEHLLEKSAPGVLHSDLSACNAYAEGAASAAKITCPTLLILGERDMMSPLKAGRALAAQITGSRTIVLPGAGHMMMIERPEATLDALRSIIPHS